MKKIIVIAVVLVVLTMVATGCTTTTDAIETEAETIETETAIETDPWELYVTNYGKVHLVSIRTPYENECSLEYKNYKMVAYSEQYAYLYVESLHQLVQVNVVGKTTTYYGVAGFQFLPEEKLAWWWSDEEWTKAGTFPISEDTVVLFNTPSRWFE